MQLLFFDTFSHENSEDFILDLVQFPNPVHVTEIRIIPLGTRVQADFPGGVRLGATNPSQFHVDFFVNDLSKNGAATFHLLGSMEYKHNVEIQMSGSAKIPTDGLLLRGHYTTITLAVFGHITKVTKEKPLTPPLQSAPATPAPSVKAKIQEKNESNAANTDHGVKTSEEEKVTEEIIPSETAKPKIRTPSSPQRNTISSAEKAVPLSSEPRSIPSVRDNRESPGTHSSSKEAFVQRREDGKSTSSSSSSSSDPRGRNTKGDRRELRRERETDRSNDRERLSGSGRSRDRPREPPPDGELDSRANRSSGIALQQGKRSVTPPPPPPPRSRPPSPKGRRPRTPTSPHPSEVEAQRQPCTPPMAPPEQEPIEDKSGSAPQTELFEPLTPETSPTEPMETMSEGEPQEAGYPDYYEEILSEEEEMSEGESDRTMEFQCEMDYDMGDDAYVTTFNPYNCEFTALQYFTDPSLTPFEVESAKTSPIIKDNLTDVVQLSPYLRLTGLLRQEARNKSPEKWVEAIETIPSMLVSASNEILTDNEGVMNLLIDWCCEALDFELALQQPQAVFKVRQLKAGIKLSTALFACHRELVLKLLKKEIQAKLLSLYTKEYMALSLKLLILKALDASTRLKEGMLTLVQCSTYDSSTDGYKIQDDSSGNTVGRSGYQTLLDIFLEKQPTRASVAIIALLNKVHFFEVLHKFQSSSEIIANGMSPVLPVGAKTVPEGNNEKSLPQQSQMANVEIDDTDQQSMTVAVPKDLIDKSELRNVASCLHEILHVIINAQRLIAQPRRSLPVKLQFEFNKNLNNPHPHIYSLLNDSHFMESLLLLMSFPPMALQPTLLPIICDLLSEFMNSQHGMLYLLSRPAVCNVMMRSLLQSWEDASDENALSQLGLQFAHHLQVLQCVDALLSEVRDAACLGSKEIDDPDILSNLHTLFTMTFTPLGRSAVVNVLASERNLEAIFPFLQPTGNEELDVKLRKSACIGYATELLLITVRQSENVTLLENYSEKLLAVCSQELTSKLQDLGVWLAPTSKIQSFSHHALPHLCAVVVAAVDDVVACPGELITALRILQHLCIRPARTSSPHPNEDEPEELKYKYVIVQLFANNILSVFLTMLQKLCDAHEYPTLHAPSLVGQRGALLLAVIKPTVAMILCIFGYLTHCRGAEFKDFTSVKTLLRTYTLLSSFPPNCYHSSVVQKVLTDVVDTLLTFTQPDLDASDSEDVLANSLWTQMVREVLAYSLLSPNLFISGLTVLSELLPLPLPIHSQEALQAGQVNKTINSRKLWSAHLHSLGPLIQDVITTLGGTGDQTLQHLVRRICIQLADLSAPTALMIVRGLLDAVLDGLAMIEDASRDNFHFGHLSKLLNLLAVLMSNGCMKASLLHLVRGTTKMDLKYGELLPKLAKNLNHPPIAVQKITEKAVSFQQTQECIASIFQSVCDNEITLISMEKQLPHLEQITNSLPTKDQLTVVCGALWDHLSEGVFSSPSFVICLRTLVMLTEHDYGFFHLKTCLDNRTSHLHVILSAFCAKFNKGNSDFVSSLSTFLELIRLLVSLESEGPQRTLEVSHSELASYLKWEAAESKTIADVSTAAVDESPAADGESVPEAATAGKEVTEEPVNLHPLLQLEKLLTEPIQDEESLEGQTLEHVQWLINLLKGPLKEQTAASEKEFPEVVLPPAESLLQQFTMRLTCVVGDVDEEALNSSFWMPQSGDDSDLESEQVSCNLKAMADEYCPGLDFATELGNMFLAKDDDIGDKERKDPSSSKRRYQTLINSGSKEPAKKKPFIAPMRGRSGYARGMIHSSRANDPFRSRPPNTSRPPSMHVDDFVAMEIFQPSSSSTSQSSKRTSKDSSRGRGRGTFDANPRDFGTTRGRFFQSTSPVYSRRDERGRGNSRGTCSRSTGSNVWTRDGASPSQHMPSPSQSSKLKFGSVTPRSSVRSGHGEPRSESRIQANRVSEGQRGISGGSGSGNLVLWPTGIRSKERESRFPSASSQNQGGRRETSRHTRAFTR